jgi:hypothetical protein
LNFFHFYTNKKRPQWGEIRIPKLLFFPSNSKYARMAKGILKHITASRKRRMPGAIKVKVIVSEPGAFFLYQQNLLTQACRNKHLKTGSNQNRMN